MFPKPLKEGSAHPSHVDNTIASFYWRHITPSISLLTRVFYIIPHVTQIYFPMPVFVVPITLYAPEMNNLGPWTRWPQMSGKKIQISNRLYYNTLPRTPHTWSSHSSCHYSLCLCFIVSLVYNRQTHTREKRYTIHMVVSRVWQKIPANPPSVGRSLSSCAWIYI